MKKRELNLNLFLKDNDFELEELPLYIQKQIQFYNDEKTLLHYASAKLHPKVFEMMCIHDKKIIQEIKSFFIKQLDKIPREENLLKKLYLMGCTHHIHLDELREIGITSKLFWNGTIIGKFELLRPTRKSKWYYIRPVALGTNTSHYQKVRQRHKEKNLIQPNSLAA